MSTVSRQPHTDTYIHTDGDGDGVATTVSDSYTQTLAYNTRSRYTVPLCIHSSVLHILAMAAPNLTPAQRRRVQELLEAQRRRGEADRKAQEDEAAEQVERQRYEEEVKAYRDAIGRQFIEDRKAARAQAQGMGSQTSISKDWASLYNPETDCYADIWMRKMPQLGLSLHNIGLDPLYSEYAPTQGRRQPRRRWLEAFESCAWSLLRRTTHTTALTLSTMATPAPG
jgi:hypothetical protein